MANTDRPYTVRGKVHSRSSSPVRAVDHDPKRMVLYPSAGWRTRSLPSSAGSSISRPVLSNLGSMRFKTHAGPRCSPGSGPRDGVALTIVSGKTVAVGREAAKGEDGDLGQADAHYGEVSRHAEDGRDAPYSQAQGLGDVDAAYYDGGINEGYETLTHVELISPGAHLNTHQDLAE